MPVVPALFIAVFLPRLFENKYPLAMFAETVVGGWREHGPADA